MKKYILPIIGTALIAAAVSAANSPQILSGFGPEPSTATWLRVNTAYTGDWQQYGEVFTNLHSGLVKRIFLLILTLIPALFLIHYIVIGPKHFDNDGPQVLFFPTFVRLVHTVVALSFSLLVITGLLVIFGKLLNGGTIIMYGRSVHLLSALVFALSAVLMLLIWFKDMLPRPHDIAWLFIMGGYLSKEKKPVPAGKFNAGQKLWFWLATVGGGVMTYTGWYLYTFQTTQDMLRIMALIHDFLGAALVAIFLVHLYMSLFAIKGAITSMITGYKPRKEVEILHSRYKIPS